MKVDPAGYRGISRYDDVWSRAVEICPYCACELNSPVMEITFGGDTLRLHFEGDPQEE